MFRVGIVGMGTVAKVHQSVLAQLPDTELVACCDINPAKQVHGTAFYTDYHQMAQEQQLDAVHICLPHYLHEDAAETFAKRHIPVLCEKPVSISVASCKRMQQLEPRYGVPVAVCLQNRWNATFRTLQKKLHEPDCGAIVGIKAVATWARPASYYAEAPWRGEFEKAGGGCMLNQAVHTLDLLLQIGGEVQRVKGSIMNLSDYPITVEDSAAARIAFKNGAVGLFFGSVCNADNASIEVQVSCSNAIYTIKDYALWYHPPGQEDAKTLLVRDAQMPGTKSYYGPSHQDLIADFYANLRGEQAAYVSVADASTVIGLIEAVRTSSLQQKAVTWKEIVSK